MRLRFFFVRAAAGTLALGSAAPVNLPFGMQAFGNVVVARESAAAGREKADRPKVARGAQAADANDLHSGRHLLKIATDGDLPCDSGEWATSPLFAPRGAVAAVLGVQTNATGDGARDTALADALADRPATGDAESSAYGSVFGNLSQPAFGAGAGIGKGGDTGAPSGPTIGGGTIPGGGPFTGGTTVPSGPDKDSSTGGGAGGGTGGGDTNAGSDGGSGPPAVGTDGSNGGTGAGAGGSAAGSGGPGATGGSYVPPIDTILPVNPGSGDHSAGDPSIGGDLIRPDAPGAVPEPTSWATMLVGFTLIGGMMRFRRRVNAPA